VNYEDMSIPELEAASNALAQFGKSKRDERLRIQAVLHAKEAQLAMQRRFERMSDPEKAALAQMLTAAAVPPANKVGEPGK
jgi:hypothetical protein